MALILFDLLLVKRVDCVICSLDMPRTCAMSKVYSLGLIRARSTPCRDGVGRKQRMPYESF